MVQIKVKYGEFMHSKWQTKSFKSVQAAVLWCMNHYEKIQCINNYRTFYRPMLSGDVKSAIEGVCN